MAPPLPILPLRPDHLGVRLSNRRVDVVGDVHGCHTELDELMAAMGYAPPTWTHPEGRLLLFVGDLTNRGPFPIETLRRVRELIAGGHALMVLGNHDHEVLQAIEGRGPTPRDQVQETVDAIAQSPILSLESVAEWFRNTPLWIEVTSDNQPDDHLVVVHAAWHPALATAEREVLEKACLLGPTRRDGDIDHRLDWREGYPMDAPWCVFGHAAYNGPVAFSRRTVCLDTACVNGGRLTGLRWPERAVFHVEPRQVYAPYPSIQSAPPLQPLYTVGDGEGLAWPWNREGPRQRLG